MKTFMPWIALMPAQAHEVRRVAGFLYGWLQREHELNLRAYDTWWTGSSSAARSQQPLDRGAKARPAHGDPHRRRYPPTSAAATAITARDSTAGGSPRPRGTARRPKAASQP